LITGLGYAFSNDDPALFSRWVARRLYGFALKRATGIFFQNSDDSDLFLQRGFLSAGQQAIIVNGSGVDLDRYQLAPVRQEEIRFLFIGRFLVQKGVREFAEVARRVKNVYPNVQFLIAGWIEEGPGAITAEEVEKWVSEGWIENLGRLHDVRSALASASVFVLPSYREGTPRTVLEAMAIGRPIITTDVPGCRQTVDEGETGFLVPARSVEALEAAVVRFIEEPSLIPVMGGKARLFAEEKYDVKSVNQKMCEGMGIGEDSRGEHGLMLVTTVPLTLTAILKKQPAFLSTFFKTTLVTSPSADVEEIVREEGVPVYTIPMWRGISPLRDLCSMYAMIALILRLRPTVIHSYTPKAGLVAMLSACLLRVPIRVHTFTGLVFPTESGLKRRVLMLVDRLICACATHVIPEGAGVKRDLINGNITRKNLELIGNGNIAGIDIDYFSRQSSAVGQAGEMLRHRLQIAKQDFIFCYVGRIHKDKGIFELLRAFESLPERCQLLLVGDFDINGKIDAATLEIIKKNTRVRSLGFLQDIRPALFIADVLVLPSYREGFPNVILQASAMELPVIVTDVNGSNEIVEPNRNGWIVPPRNLDALKTTMLDAMNVPSSVRTDMGTYSRKVVSQKFERKAHWKRMVEFYYSLIGTARSRDS
jgi:glycosyltransferase involved in cell wall biosynthesis